MWFGRVANSTRTACGAWGWEPKTKGGPARGMSDCLARRIRTFGANGAFRSGRIRTFGANGAFRSGRFRTFGANGVFQSGRFRTFGANGVFRSGRIRTFGANAAFRSGRFRTFGANGVFRSGRIRTFGANGAKSGTAHEAQVGFATPVTSDSDGSTHHARSPGRAVAHHRPGPWPRRREPGHDQGARGQPTR